MICQKGRGHDRLRWTKFMHVATTAGSISRQISRHRRSRYIFIRRFLRHHRERHDEARNIASSFDKFDGLKQFIQIAISDSVTRISKWTTPQHFLISFGQLICMDHCLRVRVVSMFHSSLIYFLNLFSSHLLRWSLERTLGPTMSPDGLVRRRFSDCVVCPVWPV